MGCCWMGVGLPFEMVTEFRTWFKMAPFALRVHLVQNLLTISGDLTKPKSRNEEAELSCLDLEENILG